MRPLVAKINRLEEELQALTLTEEDFHARTAEFRKRIANGETVTDILPEAFALVKNACRRLCGTKFTVCDHEMEWNMIPYDVQLMGGIVLNRGHIAEMATGEGKTLVATLPLYLNALTGKNCQLVTVNDYLAQRDSEWMGILYKYLGLTVGCIQNWMDPTERRDMYTRDITYGTNSEFGFDYLRDMGMATEKDQLVQRDYYFVIIDEVDSILIDEARTPLIISGPVQVSTHQFDKLKDPIAELYKKQHALCNDKIIEAKKILDNPEASEDELDDALLLLAQVRMGMPTNKKLMHILEDGSVLKQLEKKESFIRSDINKGMLQEVQAGLYFNIDEKRHEADLTDMGRNEISPNDPNAFIVDDMLEVIHTIDNDEKLDEAQKAQKKNEFQQAFSEKTEMLHNISQLLRAYCLFEKDVHYVVQDGKVMIVDEHTGRLMPGRRFSDGLHQALEAKEHVVIEKETQTLATITIQNYFRMYDKLAGMTGTAETEATELHQIYKLDVTVIPTNRPCLRIDENDSIYKTRRAKFNAIVQTIAELHAKGQPVLLGTISVDDSEVISRLLKRQNIPHSVLNAKNHQHEAEIVANAGQVGAVTVATNMAGRGTDIKLGEGVAELGGLCVIGSARHDSRRIDRQLRGRCSRQGDPGLSKFYVSLEDNLMRLFGSDRIVKIMEKFGMEEDEDLQHPWLNHSIETAQRRVEQHHFSVRKRTLEYDDVMNKQREIIYGIRREALISDEPINLLYSILEEETAKIIEDIQTVHQKEAQLFNYEKLIVALTNLVPVAFTEDELKVGQDDKKLDFEKLLDVVLERIKNAYQNHRKIYSDNQAIWMDRHIVIEAIDQLWQEHLHQMDHLRSSISLRQYAQKDPLVEYRQEAFSLFETLMGKVHETIVKNMFKMSLNSLEDLEMLLQNIPQEMVHEHLDQFTDPDEEIEPESDFVQIPYRHGAQKQ